MLCNNVITKAEENNVSLLQKKNQKKVLMSEENTYSTILSIWLEVYC